MLFYLVVFSRTGPVNKKDVFMAGGKVFLLLHGGAKEDGLDILR